jgi:hypothetical protein
MLRLHLPLVKVVTHAIELVSGVLEKSQSIQAHKRGKSAAGALSVTVD